MSFKKEYQLKTLKSGGGRRREEAGSWQEATVDARITHNKDEGIFFFKHTPHHQINFFSTDIKLEVND